MEIPQNSNNKYYLFLFVIAAIGLVSYPFVLNYTNNIVNEVRPAANKFMGDLKSRDFANIDHALNKKVDIEGLATEDNIIYSFKESGFGVDDKKSIWISYYVVGLPAETRNININYIKQNQQWHINDIKVSYEISRIDKKNVLGFINKTAQNNINDAFICVKGINKNEAQEIISIIQQYSCTDKWNIIKAVNKPLPKFPDKMPTETLIYIESPDKIHTLCFLCKQLKNKNWIESIKTGENSITKN